MPLLFIAAVAIIFLVLCASEFWWRKRKPDSELSRKFVHLSVGSFVAFWPFFLSWTEIRLLCVGFIVVVLVSKKLKIFQAIHSVQRPTHGELYFALVVGVMTFVTHSKGIYAAGLLQMSLADGLAAVIGVRYGKRQRYNVFGHPKSVVGTLTFFITSLALLIGYSAFSSPISLVWLLGLSAGATVLENLAVGGLDNLLVPLLIAGVLTQIR
jgi:phytol kinase